MVGSEKSWWLYDDSDPSRRRRGMLPEAWRLTEEQYQAELDAIEAALSQAEAKIEAETPEAAIAAAPVEAEMPAAAEEMSFMTEPSEPMTELVDAATLAEEQAPESQTSVPPESTSAIEELHALLESARESAYESSLEPPRDADELLSEAALDEASRWATATAHLTPLIWPDEGADDSAGDETADAIDNNPQLHEQSVALAPVEPLTPLEQMMRNTETRSWRVEVPGEPVIRRETPMISRPAQGGNPAVLAPFATPATKSQLREGLQLAHARIIELLGENDHAVVAVCSAFAGEGKTTMALALADMLADEFPRQMLLIDAHLSAPGVHSALDVGGTPGTKDCLEQGAVVSGAIRWSGRHWVMPAGDGPIDPTTLTWEGERGLLRTLKALFRVTIVDMPAVMAHAQEASLLARWADGVVWVAAAASAPADAVSSAVDVVGREKLLGVVLNKRRAAMPGWLERLF